MGRSRKGRRQDAAAPRHQPPQGRQPRFASHGKLLEEGKADLYNACEWGNYSRVEGTKVGSRQVGRRSIVTFAALVVRGDSPVQTPQQFANRQIGVPFFFGTHYLTLQMLEGFVPRDQIKLGRVPNGSPYRFKLLMNGRDRGHHADRALYLARREEGLPAGHLGVPSRHRGRLRPRRCRDLQRLQSRGARGGAPHQRQQARLPALLHRLLQGRRIRRSPSSRSTICAKAASTWSIRRRSRPTSCSAPIDWMKSWGFLDETPEALNLINADVQQRGYAGGQHVPAQ